MAHGWDGHRGQVRLKDFVGFHFTGPDTELPRKSSPFQGLCETLVLGKVATFVCCILLSGTSCLPSHVGSWTPWSLSEGPPSQVASGPFAHCWPAQGPRSLDISQTVENGVICNPRRPSHIFKSSQWVMCVGLSGLLTQNRREGTVCQVH